MTERDRRVIEAAREVANAVEVVVCAHQASEDTAGHERARDILEGMLLELVHEATRDDIGK